MGRRVAYGTCPACFRVLALADAEHLARHGWREYGGRTVGVYGRAHHGGRCFGVDLPAFELTPEGAERFLRFLVEEMLPARERDLAAYEARPILHVVSRASGFRSASEALKELLPPPVGWERDPQWRLPEGSKLGDEVHTDWVTKRRAAEHYENELRNRIYYAKQALKQTRDDVGVVELKLATWTLRELPPPPTKRSRPRLRG